MKKALLVMAAMTTLSSLCAADSGALDALLGENWYGVYMNGQKAGYSTSRVFRDDQGRAHVVEDAKFQVAMSGARQDMRVYSERVYTPGGALIEIISEVVDPAQVSRFHARVSDGELLLESTVGGVVKEVTLPAPGETVDDALHLGLWARGAPQVGDVINFSVFEPLYAQEVAGVSRIVGVEERVFNGVPTKVYHVRTAIDLMAIDSQSFVTETGLTLEDEVAGILTQRLEPEEVARDVSYSNDVIVSNAALVETPVQDPRNRERLRLALRGPVNENHTFNDDRQRMVNRGDHYEFLSRRADLDAFEPALLPVTEESVVRHLKPTAFIQSDHPKLLEKAQEIAGEEKNTLEISRKLCKWVHDNVRSSFSARLSNALEVLEHLEGDCTEHSVLFIGLARAAGIPAREIAGLIYIGGAQPGFYFHQWASVWVGRWVDVDPTFDQPAADATHVKLAEGDLYRQARIIPIIGNLKIEVLPDDGPDLFAEAAAAEEAALPDATGAGEPEPAAADAPAGEKADG